MYINAYKHIYTHRFPCAVSELNVVHYEMFAVENMLRMQILYLQSRCIVEL